MAKLVKGKVNFEEAESEFGFVKGTVKWAKVLEIGQFGDYSVDLYGEDVEKLAEKMEKLRTLAAKEVKALGKKYENFNLPNLIKTDDDGKKFIQFKLPEKNFDGENNKIKIYDVTGKEVTDTWNALIGNGSTIKIRYRVAPYYMNSNKNIGISYKFYACQVIDLKEYQAKGDSGFGDETQSETGFGNEQQADDNEDF